jgi:hypothetical protein
LSPVCPCKFAAALHAETNPNYYFFTYSLRNGVARID